MVEQGINLLNSNDGNWFKVDQALKSFIKGKIKKILLISPPQFQTSFIDLEILKNKRYAIAVAKIP